MNAKHLLTAAMLILFGWSSFALPANGQLAQDVRDVFEGMLSDLDPELRAKFQNAIATDSATVEFTPQQFRRFRDNPVNPFEGLDGIVANDASGNIALKFELPSMRNRRVGALERQNQTLLGPLNGQALSAATSTVAIFAKQRQVAMGTIVRADGIILTKASEVEHHVSIRCVLNDGRSLEAKIVRTDKENDLALLKVNADQLPVVNWSAAKPVAGSFLLTPKPDGSVLALGTYSVDPRSTSVGEQAFLGVQPETTSSGVRISDIRQGTASFAAGLKDGDVITKLAGQRIADVSDLVKSIRDHAPGDTVDIEYLRQGTASTTQATLAGRDVSGEQAARFKMMSRLGAVPSRRNSNFPNVFQHDTPLFPEQCGGPITDLNGNVVGINIARKGRASAYAIPADHLAKILKDMLRETIAAR